MIHGEVEWPFDGSWEGWRREARRALGAGCSPAETRWRVHDDAQIALDAPAAPREPAGASRVVPASFLRVGADVACHRTPGRWNLLYRVLWRLTHGEPHLMQVAVDDDVHAMHRMSRAVRREGHKLRAFVRFRIVADGTPDERYVAWFEPAHDVVPREAPFFARRFPAMRWSILTPDICVHWDGQSLAYAPGASRHDAPQEDAVEDLWRLYYASTFNPARLKPGMMRAEMPRRYWKHLPEARLIAPLMREAPSRVRAMVAQAAALDAVAPPLVGPALDANVLEARERSARARASLAARGYATGASPMTGCDLRVGVASWTDPTMTRAGVFYPDDVRSAADRLSFYASRFSLVEVDATYYALPSRDNAERWATRTPPGFMFDVKAHAIMTGHPTDVARLPDDLRRSLPAAMRASRTISSRDLAPEVAREVWQRFRSALQPLRDAGKLGALLLQLPRDFTPCRENERLLARMRELGGYDQLAIEFRHATWMDDARQRERTLAILRAHQLTHVIVDAPPGFATSMPRVLAVTDPRLAVVRLHGRRTDTWERPVAVTSERYRYLYNAGELRELSRDFIDVAYQAQGVHVLFNNCHANYGTTNADEITEMLIEADEERRRLSREGRLLT